MEVWWQGMAEELAGVVREVEWLDFAGGYFCTHHGCVKPNHSGDCPLDAALKRFYAGPSDES